MSRTIDLRYFRATEFGDWWGSMSLRLLFGLDAFRHRHGAGIVISPHPRALGRNDGDSEGQHNIDRWGEVRAADHFPLGVRSYDDACRTVDKAIEVGFTGIGAYPHWQYRGRTMFGLHADVRVDEAPGDPALWGGVDDGGGQVYVSLDEALSRMR